jgi:hypothetical protein
MNTATGMTNLGLPPPGAQPEMYRKMSLGKATTRDPVA